MIPRMLQYTALLTLVLAAGCSSVTPVNSKFVENPDLLREGMTIKEVQDLGGKPPYFRSFERHDFMQYCDSNVITGGAEFLFICFFEKQISPLVVFRV